MTFSDLFWPFLTFSDLFSSFMTSMTLGCQCQVWWWCWRDEILWVAPDDGTYIQRNITCLDIRLGHCGVETRTWRQSVQSLKNSKCKDNNDVYVYKQARQQSVNKKLYLKCIILTNIYHWDKIIIPTVKRAINQKNSVLWIGWLELFLQCLSIF